MTGLLAVPSGLSSTDGGCGSHRGHRPVLGPSRIPGHTDGRDGFTVRDAHDLGVDELTSRPDVDDVVGDGGRDGAPVRGPDDQHVCAHHPRRHRPPARVHAPVRRRIRDRVVWVRRVDTGAQWVLRDAALVTGMGVSPPAGGSAGPVAGRRRIPVHRGQAGLPAAVPFAAGFFDEPLAQWSGRGHHAGPTPRHAVCGMLLGTDGRTVRARCHEPVADCGARRRGAPREARPSRAISRIMGGLLVVWWCGERCC